MADLSIRKITPADFDAVTDTLTRSFADDPWFTFVATQDGRGAERLRSWLRRGLVARTFPFGETYVTADGSGVALWIPPNVGFAHRLPELELRLALARAAGFRRMHEVRQAIRVIMNHEPERPHRELRIIAVAPEHQRRGIGATLMQSMLDRCDVEATGAALLCTKESNIGFYERFGFEVASAFTVPGGPTLWQMWRDPR